MNQVKLGTSVLRWEELLQMEQWHLSSKDRQRLAVQVLEEVCQIVDLQDSFQSAQSTDLIIIRNGVRSKSTLSFIDFRCSSCEIFIDIF